MSWCSSSFKEAFTLWSSETALATIYHQRQNLYRYCSHSGLSVVLRCYFHSEQCYLRNAKRFGCGTANAAAGPVQASEPTTWAQGRDKFQRHNFRNGGNTQKREAATSTRVTRKTVICTAHGLWRQFVARRASCDFCLLGSQTNIGSAHPTTCTAMACVHLQPGYADYVSSHHNWREQTWAILLIHKTKHICLLKPKAEWQLQRCLLAPSCGTGVQWEWH